MQRKGLRRKTDSAARAAKDHVGVAVAWSFLFVPGGAMGFVVAVPGALAVGIDVRLLRILKVCDEHQGHLSLSKETKGVMEHDLNQRWSAA